jgi:acetyltransferase-like isoleucine patch superfamily enzyme
MKPKLERRWRRGWMKLAHRRPAGSLAARLAGLGLPPHTGKVQLARFSAEGYVSPSARISHDGFVLGQHCFVGDHVLVLREAGGETVELGDRVHVHEDNNLQTGQGGAIHIGSDTHIQPRCQFSAYIGDIRIGQGVEIAPNCGFYPYNHGMARHLPIRQQPLESRGGIVIEDEAWLGFGAIVLDGAAIRRGAVVAAGAVVSGEIPEYAIAGGAPARVIGMRR